MTHLYTVLKNGRAQIELCINNVVKEQNHYNMIATENDTFLVNKYWIISISKALLGMDS